MTSRAVRSALVLAAVLSLFAAPSLALAGATLYLSPAYAAHTVGDQFDVQVLVDTGGSGMSAAEAELSFDPAALSVMDVSTDGSILGSWPTPPSFSSDGAIRFTGWTSAYYAGHSGLLVTVRFAALRPGTPVIGITSGTVLAAGDAGSNILSDMEPASVSIVSHEFVPAPSGESVAPAPVPEPPPAAPTLAASSSAAIGDRIAVSGTAQPGATIYLWLEKDEDLPERSTLSAGPDGSFTFTAPDPALPGTYTAWAQAEGNDGQKSALSQKITVTVSAGDLAASAAGAGVASGIMPLIALILLAAFGGYIYYRHS